jgi:hypothetical protein
MLSKSITKRVEGDGAEFVQLNLQVRYRRVPTRWEGVPTQLHALAKPGHAGFFHGKGPLYEVSLVPTVSPGATADRTLDPFRLRSEFLKLDVNDREATLAFLTVAGLWELRPNVTRVGEKPFPRMNPVTDVIADFRRLNGLAVPIAPGQLREAQIEWNERLAFLSQPQKLHKYFFPPPTEGNYSQQFAFALSAEWYNTIPMHVEWHGKAVQGVIQPVSMMELLNVTLLLDLLRNEYPQVCQRHDCRTRFTGRKRKHCTPYCAQLEAVRAHRRRKDEEKRGWLKA